MGSFNMHANKVHKKSPHTAETQSTNSTKLHGMLSVSHPLMAATARNSAGIPSKTRPWRKQSGP